MITEGLAKINVVTRKIVSKKMDVFYNPVMELNRTSSVLLLNALDKKGMQIGLPLEGSGIRGMRFLKELKKGMIKSIAFNDYDPKAVKKIKENLKLNKLDKDKRIEVHQKDASLFLLESFGFDYIDIDPFGTPNPFLDAAVKRLARDGILAVTATDTAPLSGTYPEACLRKYWAFPVKSDIMHEVGLRILVRKIQLVGAQYDKAFAPIFSFSKEHYMRVYLRCEK
ncbi:tRNA (guanine(10)-N(2))-dimethyltransferase, partial [Candidatus Woesearchaeota archaeon]|nr:tRNA (guanine(10)-N(2))-dimethyltransferase [Candidatus Woesearchaeota archaeon]